jgi:5-methyltetrahydrofolate--homocysteine methyltransferase
VNRLEERLLLGPCLLLDGGLGSMLIAAGLPSGAPPDRWNLERPETVRRVHRDYVEAGSEAIHCNTFGSNPTRLARFGLADRCEEINRTGVLLARQAGSAFLIGDMGPTGEYLPPIGQGDPELWREGFARQAKSLAEAGVDALHLETMSDLREALLALESSRQAAPGLPVLVSLTFERKKRGFFTVMGDPLCASLASLARAGAVAVGANCSVTCADMRVLAEEALRDGALTKLSAPLVVQPNAGQPRLAAGTVVYDGTAEEFAALMAPLAAGVSTRPVAALGGCCGTDPRFITALKLRLRSGIAS